MIPGGAWIECPNCHREYPSMAYFEYRKGSLADLMRCVYCWKFGWSHVKEPKINEAARQWSLQKGLAWVHEGLDPPKSS